MQNKMGILKPNITNFYVRIILRKWCLKGQLISKGLFGYHRLDQKANDFFKGFLL